MTALTLTRHGEARLSQRGIRKADLEVLLTHGTDIGRDRIMLTRRGAAEAIGDLKRRIADVERLAGKVLVVTDGHLITAYHQTVSTRPSGQRTRRSDARLSVSRR